MLYDGAHVTCRIDLLVHDNAAKGNVALVHGVVKYLLKALFSLIVMVADHLFQREESVVKVPGVHCALDKITFWRLSGCS